MQSKSRKLVMFGAATAVLSLGALTVSATADDTCVTAWHPLTAGGQIGVGGDIPWVWALTVWNGDLIAGGSFTTAGGQTVNRIARWDGSAWHPFTSGGQIGVSGGANSQVHTLTVWNGDLIAGGVFTHAGGQTVRHIARWDGSAWHPFTSGGQIGVGAALNSGVYALAVWNGDLIVGGLFIDAGGQTVNSIARWDGSAWNPFTSGGQIGTNIVRALTVWNGNLIAGGNFFTAGGQMVNNIARWDGSAWHAFTSGGQIGVSTDVRALTVRNGHLVAGGDFSTAGGQSVSGIARWDGSAWHPFYSGGQTGAGGHALTVWNGDLIAGGNFTTAGGQTVNRIARWYGSPGAWYPMTSGAQIGVNSTVLALAVWNGDVIAGGIFTTAGGQTVNRIARWDGCLAPPCPGDVNGDGVVDVLDLLALLDAWGPCPECGADLNGDKVVDVLDLLMLLDAWGPCP